MFNLMAINVRKFFCPTFATDSDYTNYKLTAIQGLRSSDNKGILIQLQQNPSYK